MLRRMVAICTIVSCLMLSGCWFSATVGNAFFGSERHRLPSSPNRYATGVFLAPFAIVLDVVTFPVQFIVLLIGGDDVFDNFFLYVQLPNGEWELRPLAPEQVETLLITGDQCVPADQWIAQHSPLHRRGTGPGGIASIL